jgi:hypothetical protein
MLERVYSVGSEPENENPLPQAYVEARHTLQVSHYNLSKRVIGDISFKIKKIFLVLKYKGNGTLISTVQERRKQKIKRKKEKKKR